MMKNKEELVMSKNYVNPCKVITGVNTRWSYANVWEPKSINGGTPKYSVSLIIPKSDTKTIAKIEAAIEAAYKEGEAKLKGNGKSVPASLSSRLRFVMATWSVRTIGLRQCLFRKCQCNLCSWHRGCRSQSDSYSLRGLLRCVWSRQHQLLCIQQLR